MSMTIFTIFLYGPSLGGSVNISCTYGAYTRYTQYTVHTRYDFLNVFVPCIIIPCIYRANTRYNVSGTYRVYARYTVSCTYGAYTRYTRYTVHTRYTHGTSFLSWSYRVLLYRVRTVQIHDTMYRVRIVYMYRARTGQIFSNRIVHVTCM